MKQTFELEDGDQITIFKDYEGSATISNARMEDQKVICLSSESLLGLAAAINEFLVKPKDDDAF